MRVLGAAAAKRSERKPLPPAVLAAAGPLAIVALVLVVLHDVVFGGAVFARNPDLLAFWMPNQCLLGQELMAGRIPYWNPHALAGTPFAADPQSGWMYLPMMALSLLPCEAALRALVVFFPILAGLGAYVFLRGEGARRAAATLGGVVLAGVCAGSALAVTLTFVGFMAWSPWLLAAASASVRARRWSARIGWATATAFVWGQLAAAHLSNGLVMGTALLVTFWIYKQVSEIRAGRSTWGAALGLAVFVAIALIAANAAYLLPRLAYLQRSTIGLGYEGLFALRNELWGLAPATPPTVRITEPAWILRLATSPGAYLGAAPLALCFGGLFARRWRALSIGLWIYAIGFYAIGTRQVAAVLEPLIGNTVLGDFYGHAPARFAYAPILALCLLAGLGAEAWRAEPSLRRRALMLVPGILLWGLVPLLAGAVPARMLLPAVAAAISLPLLFVAAHRPATWALLALVVAVELAVNGIHGQRGVWERDGHGLTDPRIVGVEPLGEQKVDTSRFASHLPVLAGLDVPSPERWMTLHPPLYILGQQQIHGVNEAQGYNPVQLRRYWTYTRAIERRGVDPRPRLTVFRELPDADALDLLQVHYVATDTGEAPAEGLERVAADDGWTVWAVPDPAPAAAVYASYESWPSRAETLAFVTDPGFDPANELVVERDGISAAVSHAPVEPAELRWLHPSAVEIATDADEAGFLLVRVPYDDYWEARVDGRRVPVLPGNHFLQAVEVPRGRRVVHLAYRDPWIVRGLWAGAAALATVAAAWLLMRRRENRNVSEPEPAEAPSS